MERAIKTNVDTDDFHRNELFASCELAIEGLKSDKTFDEVNTRMIGFTIRTIFMLLGHFPDNWERRSTSNPKTWRLDQFRKLAYVRTPEQKVNLILSLTDKHGFSNRLPEWRDLISKLHAFKGDADRFIKWFKKNHADVYEEIV